MSSQISEDDIRAVVQDFYVRVRSDPILAPIFATKIETQAWPDHIDHIADFWSSIFLKTGRFDGNPMRKHLAISGITPAHFNHWLSLFKITTDAVLSPAHSDAMHTMAERIAQSLQMGLAFNYAASGEAENPFKEFAVKRSHETFERERLI